MCKGLGIGCLLVIFLFADALAVQSQEADTSSIQCDVTHEGDLVVWFNEVFTIEDITYCQKGNVDVYDTARFIIKSARFVFLEAYFQEFHFVFHNRSSVLIDNSSLESTYYAHSLCLSDFSTGQIVNSNLSEGQLFLEGGSSLEILNSNVLHVNCADSCKLIVTGSSLNELVPTLRSASVATFTSVKPGYYADWNLHRDNEVENWPTDITLIDTSINNWNFDIGGSAVAIFEDCVINQLAPSDQSHVTVRDSTIVSPVLFFEQNQTIELKDLRKGFISHWSLQDLSSDPDIRQTFIIENSEITGGWYVGTGATDLTIVNSELARLWAGFNTPTAKARVINSHIEELALWNHRGTLIFEDTLVTKVAYPKDCRSRFRGTVRFTDKELHSVFGPWYHSTITREFPVLVQDSSGFSLPNVDLDLYSSQNELIWSGKSDYEGEATFEIIFTDTNYQDEWTLRATLPDGEVITRSIRFLTDTPIVISPTSGA